MTLPGFEIATPFRGPGWESDRGVLLTDASDTVVVALTHAEAAAGSRGDFHAYVDRVVESLPDQEGLVGWALRRELLGRRVWTMTIWRDEEALDDFLVSPAHRAAMHEARDTFAAASFRRVAWPTAAVPPTWDQARALVGPARPAPVTGTK